VLIIMAMVSGAAAFFVGLETGRFDHLAVWLIIVVLLPLCRAGIRHVLNDTGLWLSPAIMIGTGPNAVEAWRAIRSEHNLGYRLLGFVDVNSRQPLLGTLTVESEAFPVLDHGALKSLPPGVKTVIALESLGDESAQLLVQRLVSQLNNVHVVPSIRGLPLYGTQLSHFMSHDVLLLTLQNNLARRSYKWIKRGFDLVFAGGLLLVLSPIFLYLALSIRRDGGKALYGHTRVGHNGKAFKCLKFRSMRSDAEKVLKELLATNPTARAEWDKDFKLKNDPRINALGHFLRRSSIDELPQLWNVLKGDMSLVGPRPVVKDELERYGDDVAYYLLAKPGMTGLWQVSGRNDVDYETRVYFDSWYVKNWSLWTDITILFKTINVLANRQGAY
jgi:Undecaprenyl-phosphate galactose phosphotransferase WbaP